ncbi:major facilitator superfamily domain-containing protein 6 [Cylas formicarius]|uniref:major facilitator superfamily domain-containing protein 6 n=1 Tax=Cylas formicarius TaxID=197179 RepID=UPI002958DC76|nr:major facilitator superfamily domain-containing protein 6 [Cylas formicarius]
MNQHGGTKEEISTKEETVQSATEMEDNVEILPPQKTWYGINKNLIMLKITLFFLYGATSSLIPYLTIHMQSIGLKMEDIALIYLSLPFTTFLAPPITGYLVDKFGRYKPVVIVSFLLSAILHHSLLLIPPQETPGQMPSAYVITHPKKLYVEVWWSPCPSRECPEHEELDVVLDTCVDYCLLKNAKQMKQEGLNLSESDPGDLDDLIFHLTRNKTKDAILDVTLDMHENLGEPIEQLGIEIEEEDENVVDLEKRFSTRMLKRYGVNVEELDEHDLRCGGKVMGVNRTTKSRLAFLSKDCILQKCQFRTGGPEICPPDFKESDSRTFWIYFVLRFVGTVMVTAGVTIMDPLALSMIEKYGGDFGKERLFSSLGMAIFSPITGFLIDLNSKRLGYTDYSAAFYTFDFLLVVSSIAVFLMPLGTKLPADNVFSGLVNIFKMPKVVVFILFLFILGNLWGFIESFLFFYLKDLGAPNSLLGITVTVGTISSLPFLYGAENITKKLGHVNIIIIAFFAHAARLMGYSVIESAWWCFPFEAMESISVHLMWVAAATYCAILAPSNLLATLIGVCGMAHYSIGRGSGSFVGGNIIGKFGIRQSFRLMGLLAILSGILYAILHWTWLKNIPSESEDEEAGTNTTLQNGEPKYKDQSTMVSMERLSIMVEYNQIGSLTSLGRQHIIRARSNSIRRGSYSGATKNPKVSKSDLLKSALEVNTKSSAKLNKLVEAETNSGIKSGMRKSQSVALPERQSLIPNEKDEIVYEQVKKQSENNDQVP